MGDARGDERRVPAGTDEEAFLFCAKGARTVHRFLKQPPKVTRSVQEDQDDGLARTEVSTEPTGASWQEAFAGEDHL